MGYRGKVEQQNRARDLRAQGWTIKEIEAELGVSRSSVSIWVRDVEVDPAVWAERVGTRRNHGWEKRRETFDRRSAARATAVREQAEQRLGQMTDRDLFIAGLALYAGEGSKGRGSVTFPNSDPRMISLFLAFLRRFFSVDESRLRVRIYLHEGLDIDAATAFWSGVMAIPQSQFRKPYRAKPDPTIRTTKHPMGCPSVRYSCTETHETIMGLVTALLTSDLSNPG
jgi:Putative ATPase subunit of terminase (gpP-like)